MEADARTRYSKMKASFGEMDIQEEFCVVNGSITAGVRAFVKDKNMDLIVMGTHGASGLKEVFVGSNTERIVRYASVPVISVRRSADVDSIKKIVFPVMVDYGVEPFVNRLHELKEFFEAELHFVYIVTPNNFRKYTEIRKEIGQWKEYYGLSDATLEIRSDLYEQDGIIEYAKEVEADMIAMGTHGRRGVAHLLAGSIAEDVVNHMECPIWTYSLTTSKTS
jgi:nucleotide-binding universal stress UspA family protein